MRSYLVTIASDCRQTYQNVSQEQTNSYEKRHVLTINPLENISEKILGNQEPIVKT